MVSKGKGKSKRVTVNLDSESLERLDDIQDDLRISKSEVVRRALRYFEVVREKGNLDPDELETTLDLRLRPDNLLFDIGIFQAFLEEIGDPSENLKKDIKNIGKDFYTEYCAIGLKQPIQCLKRLERTNLFRLIVNSEKRFTVIPIIPELGQFLKDFFEGYIEASDLSGEISMTRHKVRIKIR